MNKIIFLQLISTILFGQNLNSLLQAPLQNSYHIFSVFGEKEMDIKLQAILNDKALIHNKWYHVGQKIGKFYVHRILKDSVILIDKKSQQTILRLEKKVF